MTSVEKRRSRRKSGVHRKHGDGGYSDTSSGGSFLDETDREVSNLTDRAFRSLCIGDEAVYNDSDCLSSPCTQRDRQLAFSESGLGRHGENREELKRAAHESFSLRVQQYGQDWIHGGMYGAEIHRDPQWEVSGQRTQGRVSATFQHSFVETSQQEKSLKEEHLSFLSNGATELSLQQRRSHSRVSSLIRAFNSEGHRDGSGMDGKLGEWNDETTWDKSALMSIQRELSEFSYNQNFNNGYFPSAAPFSSRDTNFYSSEVAAVTNINSQSSFMRASHSKHSMSAQVNCNSNFFIHSEFSPFKVWRDHNRFPFGQGEVSGFMHCSEFPKWYETPMYKEPSYESHTQGPYRFDERSIRHSRNNLTPAVHPSPPRSTSTSKMMQKTSAVEKRCESEFASHHPHRKRTQSLGTNRLPSQRPSTASPTTEMSQRVRDTISSADALRQKIRMMTEQNIASGVTANQQGVICSNDNLIPFGITPVAVAPNFVNSKSSTTPFNVSQILTPIVHTHQEAETSEYVVSPQPVEHPPVRAESRGATYDVRMSSYKARATSLLFNLKDNRKRVKSTYSPTKFKGSDALEKDKQPSVQEPRDTVIDITDFPDSDVKCPDVEESSRTNAASYQYVNQHHNTGLSLTTPDCQPATAHIGQTSEHTLSNYQTAQMQGEIVHHSGFTGLIPENYTSNQLVNGQNLHEDLLSFAPYKQGMVDHVESIGGDVHRLKPSYIVTDMQRLNADNNQIGECLISEANTEQHFNETVGREFTKVDRYQQLKDNKHNYSNVSSQDRWKQTNSPDTEKSNSLKAVISPRKQEITTLIEKDQYPQISQSAAVIKEELNLSRDEYRGENLQSINKELKKTELREGFGVPSCNKMTGLVHPNISNQLPQYAPFSNDTVVENQANYEQQQPGSFKDKYLLQTYYGHREENEMKERYFTHSYNSSTEQEYANQHNLYPHKNKTKVMQETDQRKLYMQIPQGHEMQGVQSIEPKPQFQHNIQKNSLSPTDNPSTPTIANQVKDRQFVEVKAKQAKEEHIKAQHAQAALAKAQPRAQVEQPKVESARLILAGHTSSQKVKAQEAKAELTEHKQVEQAKTEPIKEEKRTGKQTEKQAEQARLTEEPTTIAEKTGAMHIKDEEGEQVKLEEVEVESPKQQMKTELVKREKTGQARAQQAEQTLIERIKAKQVEEEWTRKEEVERDWREAKQIKSEKVKAEQIKTEVKKTEQEKQKETIKQHVRAEQEKINVVEVDKVKANHSKAEDVRQEKNEVDSTDTGQVNAKQCTTQRNKPKEAKVEKRKEERAKLEQTKVELVNAEPTKTNNIQEKTTKPAAKLTMTHHVKIGPDKVEQVKTELAKAKAELAKIKEKMKGEQKERARNVTIKEDNISNRDITLGLNMNKNKNYSKDDYIPKVHQQREESIVNRYSRDQADRGVDDYDRLREKYGFMNAASTNKNKVSSVESLFSHSAKETDKVETINIEETKHEHSASAFTTANIENKGMAESAYVYSESSKEFKLTSANYLSATTDNRANTDTVIDKMKEHSAEKLEKCDTVTTDFSQHRDSDLTKPSSFERKPKSAEHSIGPAKDSHFTPPRALLHKERVQTKQEILTSKIKAHAEKEISAIKEKGFAMRDGFISKNSTKQLVGSPSIRQRPASQEVSKKQASTNSSNVTPKHQMEPSGIQMVQVKPVSPLSSAITQVTSASNTSQLVDHSQKQVPKEPEKSNDSVLEPQIEAKQMGSCALGIDESLLEKQKRRKHNTNHEENYGKQKEGLKDNHVVNTNYVNKKKEDPLQATTLAAESYNHMTTEKTETKHQGALGDSEPSLNLMCGQNEHPGTDDSLQIKGIMVIVRERKPSLNNIHGDNDTLEQIDVKGKVCSNLDQDSHPSSTSELCKDKTSSVEVSIAKTKDTVVQETHATVKKDPTNIDMNNRPENVQETSTSKIRKNIDSENITEKGTYIQLESPSLNPRLQRQTQLQEPLAEKGVCPPVKVLAEKRLAETQLLLYKEDIIARETEMTQQNSVKNKKNDEIKTKTEEKSPQKKKTTDTYENFMAKEVNATVNCKNDFCTADVKTVIKHDVQLSVKEDMTSAINQSRSKNIDGKSPPLLKEKMHNSPAVKLFNETSLSNHLTQKDNISPKIEENNQVDENVHIDSIAIKIVPAVTGKDNQKIEGKNIITTVASDVVTSKECKEVATCRYKEQVNPSNDEGRTENLTPADTKMHMEDSLEDKLGIQYVLSSVRKLSGSLKTNNQQNSINAPSVNTQTAGEKAEKEKKIQESVDEFKLQKMEGDYFQVQGLKETNYNINAGNLSDGASKSRDFQGLLPNKEAVSSESYKAERNEALDQNKTTASRSVSVENENMKRKNLEIEYEWDSKQSDGPTEEQSNCERLEAGQANHTRRHQPENQSIIAIRERHQRSRPSHPTKDNTVKEKPEGKPKERISTIPEISAIADYARLKVIVSEDRANALQEFAPNKKEGFFPLIQTRHSRRPVSTADQKDLSVKEKSFLNKTEVSAKVNKEPKALVFPITEKEHQRTGMFKLGDKERQDKLLLDVKSNEKHVQHLTEKNRSPSVQTKQVAGADTQSESESQINQSIHQSNSDPLRTTSSSAVNRAEGFTYLHNNSHPQSTLGQMLDMNESMMTLRKNERTEKLTVNFVTPQDEILAKQQITAKQLQEKIDYRIEDHKKTEKIRKKYATEESRSSVAEEERKFTQKENRKARESETIAMKKQTEEERAAQKEEELRQSQREEQRMKDGEEKKRVKILEERRAKFKEQKEQIKENDEMKRLKQQEEERAAQKEHLRRAAQEKQDRIDALEKQRRRVAQEEHHSRATQDKQQRRVALEEQQMRTTQEEQQRSDPLDVKQRRISQEKEQRRSAQEEQQKRAAQDEDQRRTALIEEQKQATQIEEKICANIEEKMKRKQKEVQGAQISEEERVKQIQVQKTAKQQTAEDKREMEKKEEWMRSQKKGEERKSTILQREQKQAKGERTSLVEENYAALKEEEKTVTKAQIVAQREDEVRAKNREDDEKLEAHREMDTSPETEEQKRVAQRMDALQYYAITSTESERKPRERHQRNNLSGLDLTEDSQSHTKPYRPHAPASPAPSLPRSNTSSPALGAKPSMFRVKDNTMRGSSLTKSVKPRFHKNFGEDFRVGSPMERGLEKGEEEQELMRRSSVTPVNLDTGLNRLATIKESSAFQSSFSSQDYSVPLPQHRPYSRRSFALDEDESRSVISNMSEDVESFATSATDLADVRGLYDYERPESACSFSSDVSRSLGKPPVVPPKSEKALQRAKRLTSRRIKKELSKAAADRPSGVEKPPQEVSNIPPSFATEVHSSKHHAVASPHFSPPVSLAHAPALGSSLLSSHTEYQSSHHTVHASPHATGPISLPAALPHASAPVSFPVPSPHATASASYTATPKTVAHVPSSPTLHHANPPAPVTQYHVESSYPQSYPLTQRKVLQDLGSGQYYVVDVPVQVKTKTFFDPETGKYVQLNVRESGQSTSQPQSQQTYPQSQVQPQMQVNMQQQPFSQASPAGKPLVLCQGYHAFPQGYQPISSVPPNRSSVTHHQDQQPVRENHSYGYTAPEMGQSSEGHCYSPEKTPYMDTVNDSNTEKTYNRVYNTHGSYELFPECDTNSQLAGSLVGENDNSAHSRYQPCDIITMSELEDFMEVSDC